MARKLQTFKHSETTYNRPNQNWTCGRECEGVACALGPDAFGRCRAGFVTGGEHGRTTGECIPAKGEYNKFTGKTTNTDRWFCTREAVHGGPCQDGPLPDGSCCRIVQPCRPEASLRRKRGTFTICVVGVSVAILLIFFARKPETLNHPLNPGPISATHSTDGISCADCHGDTSVTLNALSEFHSTGLSDSKLCLKCHQEIGDPDDEKVFTAHTLPADHLDLLTQKAKEKAIRSVSATPIRLQLANIVAKSHKSIACATCHQEHHGKSGDLTAVSNNQCQVCHTGQFHSFSKGHPEFTSYPYRRKTRIFFDHDTHLRRHFKDDKVKQQAKNACSQCHTENADGRMMATGSYEETCAACHDSATRSTDPLDRWDILAFPKVDRKLKEFLSEADREQLASWKPSSSPVFSPLVQILLEGETGEDAEAIIGALETLRATEAGVQLRKLSKASEEEKKAGATIASAVINRIYGDEGLSLKERLLASKWLEGAAPQDRKRLGENLADVFAQLRSRSGAEMESVSSTTDFGGIFSYEARSGKFSYKSGGHADPFLKAALDATAAKVSKVETDHDPFSELFSAVSDYTSGASSTATGRCLKCHTVDRHEDGTLAVNWVSAGKQQTGVRPITHFKHRSHVRLPELFRENAIAKDETCTSCHVRKESVEGLEQRLEELKQPATGQTQASKELEVRLVTEKLRRAKADREYPDFFDGDHFSLNPHHFRSGFESLSLESCAKCHTPSKAGDSCLLCHQYHATPSPLEPNFAAILSGSAEGHAKPPIDEESPIEVSEDGKGGDDSPVIEEGGPLIPEEGGSLIPEEGGSLIPEEGGSLIPEEGGSLIPEEGGSLIPEEGGSLIPEEGGSLIPEEGAP